MLDEFLGGEARDAGRAGKGKTGFAWSGGGAARSFGRPTVRSNTFPRSERAKSDPRSIDTLSAPFPAVFTAGILRLCRRKMRMLQGSKNRRSHRGKVLDLDGEERRTDSKAAAVVG